MSDPISNSDLFNVLLTIREDIGRLDTKADVSTQLLEKHDARLTTLETGANRQKGAAKVVMTMGTILGAVGGIVVTWLTGKH